MQPEAKLQKKIVKFLNETPETLATKVHGGQYQSLMLDVACCYGGKYMELEVKVPGRENTLTKRQEHRIKKVKEAGGISAVVTSVEDVRELLLALEEGEIFGTD